MGSASSDLATFTLLPHRKDWLITLDRTHWQFGQLQINILLVGIVFQGVPFRSTCSPRKATRIPRNVSP